MNERAYDLEGVRAWRMALGETRTPCDSLKYPGRHRNPEREEFESINNFTRKSPNMPIVVNVEVITPSTPTPDEALTLHNVIDKITDGIECSTTDDDLVVNFKIIAES